MTLEGETVIAEAPKNVGTEPFVVALYAVGQDVSPRFRLGLGSWICGRSAEADITIDDPKASRRHLGIEVGAAGVVAVDLGGANGTHLDDKLLAGRATLASGQILRIGSASFRVELQKLEDMPTMVASSTLPVGWAILKSPGEEDQIVEIPAGDHVVGRQTDCSLRFHRLDLSREHLKVVAQAVGLRVENLSQHGTSYNGKPIDGPIQLPWGTSLQVGKSTLLFSDRPPRREITNTGPRPRAPISDTEATKADKGPSVGTTAKKPTSKTLWLGGGLGVVALLAGVGFLVTRSDHTTEETGEEAEPANPAAQEQPAEAAPEAAAPPAREAAPEGGEGGEELSIDGTVKARRFVSLTCPMEGTVKEVKVKLGDTVQEGDLIAQIYNKDMAIRLGNASKELKKKQRLLHKKLVLASDVEGAQSEYNNVVQEYQATKVKAPFAGTVARLSVQPGDLASGGNHVADIVDLGSIFVDSSVDGATVGRLKSKQPALVHVDGVAEPLKATIDEVALVPDQNTGTFPVRVVLENPLAPGLRIGMSARVTPVPVLVNDEKPTAP